MHIYIYIYIALKPIDEITSLIAATLFSLGSSKYEKVWSKF